jgi:RNA polymerase sigma-70 factor (ECF subfamily)
VTCDSKDIESFDDFFRADFPRLVKFLIQMGYGWEDAKDSAAEAMLAACQTWATLRNPRAYVRTAAMHAAGKQARRDRERLVRSIKGGWLTPDHVDPIATINDHLDAGSQLLTLLDHLPHQQRVVLALHLDGFTNTEIADHLGMLAATVSSHLRHAKQRLRTVLRLAETTGKRPAVAIEGGASHDVRRRGDA